VLDEYYGTTYVPSSYESAKKDYELMKRVNRQLVSLYRQSVKV